MEEVTWTILALGLTGAGVAATWWAFTRRGTLAGLTALGWTLLVPAAWLTGLFTLLARIGTAISRWVAGLAFDPFFFVGATLAGVAVCLLLATSLLRRRGVGAAPTRRTRGVPSSTTDALADPTAKPRRSGAGRRPAEPSAAGEEFDDIEALLRQRGIE